MILSKITDCRDANGLQIQPSTGPGLPLQQRPQQISGSPIPKAAIVLVLYTSNILQDDIGSY